jgi:hypothetical protein
MRPVPTGQAQRVGQPAQRRAAGPADRLASRGRTVRTQTPPWAPGAPSRLAIASCHRNLPVNGRRTAWLLPRRTRECNGAHIRCRAERDNHTKGAMPCFSQRYRCERQSRRLEREIDETGRHRVAVVLLSTVVLAGPAFAHRECCSVNGYLNPPFSGAERTGRCRRTPRATSWT